MLRKKSLHDKAVSLRKEGLSYNEIRALVPAGHGTIWRWCADIKLTERQKERILDKQVNNKLIIRLKEGARIDKTETKKWAKDKFDALKLDYNILLISGVLLYWAEGYNSDKNRSAVFTNTDADMVRIMMRFFREILMVADDKIKIMVRIDKKGDIGKAELYWSKITNLLLERFQNPELLNMGKDSQSLFRHPNGICRVSVYDVSVRRKIDNLINLLKQK
jgi:hypothetical protein